MKIDLNRAAAVLQLLTCVYYRIHLRGRKRFQFCCFRLFGSAFGHIVIDVFDWFILYTYGSANCIRSIQFVMINSPCEAFISGVSTALVPVGVDTVIIRRHIMCQVVQFLYNLQKLLTIGKMLRCSGLGLFFSFTSYASGCQQSVQAQYNMQLIKYNIPSLFIDAATFSFWTILSNTQRLI